MAFPTATVTPGAGLTINTLPNAGQATSANSLPVVIASDQSAVAVQTPVPATVVAGQVKIATTGTAVQLPSNALVNGVVIKASPFNTAQSATVTAAVGASSSVTTAFNASPNSGYPLAPGESMSFAVPNTNAVWVNGTAGDVFSFGGN